MSRYERASSIVALNMEVGGTNSIGDDTGAKIDRMFHHARVMAFAGHSNRFNNHDLSRIRAAA